MQILSKLNKYRNRPRHSQVSPEKADQYIKETFGLSDQELQQLDKGTYKIPSQPPKQTQNTSNKEKLLVSEIYFLPNYKKSPHK